MATAGYGEAGYKQSTPLASSWNAAPTGNPADQYGSYNPPGEGPQRSDSLRPGLPLGAPGHSVLGTTGPEQNAVNALKLPTAPAGATIDPNQQYIDAFNQSLARQRQAIDSTLAANLGSMAHRRDLAAHTITKGSADVQQALANQQGTNANELTVARTAAANDPRVARQGEENTNLYNTVINAAKSTETGAEPFLQLGAQQNYDQGAAALNADALQARAALEQQQSQFAMQQALQRAGYAHDTEMQQAQFAHQDEAAKASAAAGDPYYNHALFQSNLTQARGEASASDHRVAKLSDNHFGTVAELQKFMHDSAAGPNSYGWAARALAKQPGQAGTQGHGKTLDKGGVLGQISDIRVIAALIANGLLSEADGKAWADKQSGGGSGL